MFIFSENEQMFHEVLTSPLKTLAKMYLRKVIVIVFLKIPQTSLNIKIVMSQANKNGKLHVNNKKKTLLSLVLVNDGIMQNLMLLKLKSHFA